MGSRVHTPYVSIHALYGHQRHLEPSSQKGVNGVLVRATCSPMCASKLTCTLQHVYISGYVHIMGSRGIKGCSYMCRDGGSTGRCSSMLGNM